MILARGLREGYVYITSIKLVIMGPPCVGKTAFKCLLFNWPAPKSHQSTAIAARPIRAIERVAERNEGKIWEMITGHELLKMLSDAMRALDDPANVESNPANKAEQDTSNNHPLENVDQPEVPLVETVDIISQDAELPSLSNVAHGVYKPSETENYDVTSKMSLKNVDHSSISLTSTVDTSNLTRQPLLSLPPFDLELVLNELEDAVLGSCTHPEQNSNSVTSLDNVGHSKVALTSKIESSETNRPLQKSLSFSTGAMLDPPTPKQMSTSMTHLESIDQPAVIPTFRVDSSEPNRQKEMSLSSTAKDPIYYTSRYKILSVDDTYMKEILDILAKRKKSEQLHKGTWIHLLDSGGQPQFADISRAFLRGNVVNIIVTKLTEGLSDKLCFFYSLNGKILNQPTELQMTNLQLIQSFRPLRSTIIIKWNHLVKIC